METTFLGSSGLRVSRICLGTMTFGKSLKGLQQCTKQESFDILDKFVELGGNFIDTADVYSGGETETILGEWMKERDNRESLVIATKVRFGSGDKDINGVGLSRKHILRSIAASLKRLQTDYVDLYQMHCWDDGTPIEETLMTIHDLIRQGKVHYFGVSNVTGWQLQKIVDTAAALGMPRIVSLQAQYSLLCRWTEWELQPVCQREGLCLMPWSPLKGGWLTGKIKRNAPAPAGSRVAWAESHGSKLQSHPGLSTFKDQAFVWPLLAALDGVAKECGRTTAQVALKWLLQQSAVGTVVIGARTVDQLVENCQAGMDNWTISPQDMDTLTRLSKLDVPYPYEMVWRMQAGRQHD